MPDLERGIVIGVFFALTGVLIGGIFVSLANEIGTKLNKLSIRKVKYDPEHCLICRKPIASCEVQFKKIGSQVSLFTYRVCGSCLCTLGKYISRNADVKEDNNGVS